MCICTLWWCYATRSSLAFGVGWGNNVHVHLHTMVMLRYEIVSIIHKLGVVTKWPLGNVEFKILDLILNELSESQSEYIFGVNSRVGVLCEHVWSLLSGFEVKTYSKFCISSRPFPQGLKFVYDSSIWGGVGWGNHVHVHLHTMVMLRYEIVSSIWGGWGGVITFMCICTLRWC